MIRGNRVNEGCARIYLVHNDVGFWKSDEPRPNVDLLITTADLPEYREPARLALREHGRHAASALCSVKTTSWLNNVWSIGEATGAGFDEVVRRGCGMHFGEHFCRERRQGVHPAAQLRLPRRRDARYFI